MNDNTDFFAWLDSLSDEEHHEVCERLCRLAAALGVTRSDNAPAPQEEANAEEQPADNQAAIDAAFYQLMEGFEL